MLEGVAYGLRDSLDLIAELGDAAHLGRVSGGGGRSESWLKIVASVLELPLERTAVDEGAAFGAALLGGVAGGLWASPPRRSRRPCARPARSSRWRTGSSRTARAASASARCTRRSRGVASPRAP